MKQRWLAIVTATFVGLFTAGQAQAGPIVIDGTDANDHGSFSGGKNQEGWKYMQSVLENLAPGVTNGNKLVTTLGLSGGQATAAFNSAFGNSALPGLGWTTINVDGTAGIGSYLDGGTVSGASLANTGIIYIPTVNNSSGDMDSNELAEVNAGTRPAAISNFVAGGGGLHAMSETGTGAFGWLKTLIPGITFTDLGGGGIGSAITLTGDGMTAFPGLTNADVGAAIPWHAFFGGNLGGLKILGTADFGGQQPVIIGGGAGTTFQGGSIPEPATAIILGLSLAGVAGYRKIRRNRKAA